jgi:hypothetical protein
MRNPLPYVFALTLGSVLAAQEPEPAPPQPKAPMLVSMSAWLGQKLHVREPLRSESQTPTDMLRPVAIVDDLEIDAQGRVTTFVLRPLTTAESTDGGFGYVMNQYKTGTPRNPDLRWPVLVQAVYASLGAQ